MGQRWYEDRRAPDDKAAGVSLEGCAGLMVWLVLLAFVVLCVLMVGGMLVR